MLKHRLSAMDHRTLLLTILSTYKTTDKHLIKYHLSDNIGVPISSINTFIENAIHKLSNGRIGINGHSDALKYELKSFRKRYDISKRNLLIILLKVRTKSNFNGTYSKI